MKDHVIRIRHSFFSQSKWRVVRTIQSLNEHIQLLRVQLLTDTGEDNKRLAPITIPNTLIIEDLGRHKEWLLSNNN